MATNSARCGRRSGLPLSRVEADGWMLYFVLLFAYAVRKEGGHFLFLDSDNAVVHEGGHALFSHFKDFLAVAGGTILQLVAPAPVGAPLAISTLGAEERSSRAPARLPLLLALAFHVRRQAVGYALFLLIVFDNLLYVARYMADARAFLHRDSAAAPSAATSCPIPNMHDWYNLFSRFGCCNTTLALLPACSSWHGWE